MNLRKYNPLPVTVWVLLSLALTAGYFIGSISQSVAIKKDTRRTCDWLNRK